MSDTQTQTTDVKVDTKAAEQAASTQQATTDGDTDAVIKFFNEQLKRDFKSLEEVEKTVTNLNSMVGDNAIAELRKKAEDADHFKKVVDAYANSEGLTFDKAKAELLKEVNVISAPTMQEQKLETPPSMDGFVKREEFEQIKQSLQEKDLLSAHPEAAHVLNEVKLLAASQNKSFIDVYASSGLKSLAETKSKFDLEQKEKETTAVEPNSRTMNLKEEETKQLIDKITKFNVADDKAALVSKVLGI